LAANEVISFGPWAPDSVIYQLEPAEAGQVRSPAHQGLQISAANLPRVALPRKAFDCVNLDTLKDHPAVSPLVVADMSAGAVFRLLRFPLSLQKPQAGYIDEARFTVSFDEKSRRARVHSIFPTRIDVEKDQTTEVAIQPTLKLGALADVEIGRVGRSVAVRQSQAVTIGFWNENGADWIMRAPGRNFGLEGSWEFLVVARWEKKISPLQIQVGLTATVGTSSFLWRTKRLEHQYEPIHLQGCISI
jgi:hypothetical protein